MASGCNTFQAAPIDARRRSFRLLLVLGQVVYVEGSDEPVFSAKGANAISECCRMGLRCNPHPTYDDGTVNAEHYFYVDDFLVGDEFAHNW